MPEMQELEHLARTQSTLCLFLSVHKIGSVAQDLAVYYGTDCPVAVVFHASWPDQKLVRGSLADVAEKVEDAQIKKTAMIIVGQALSRDIPVSKLYHRHFSHGYRQSDSKGDET